MPAPAPRWAASRVEARSSPVCSPLGQMCGARGTTQKSRCLTRLSPLLTLQQVWAGDTGAAVAVIDPPSQTYSLCYDGALVWAGGWQGIISTYNPSSLQIVRRFLARVAVSEKDSPLLQPGGQAQGRRVMLLRSARRYRTCALLVGGLGPNDYHMGARYALVTEAVVGAPLLLPQRRHHCTSK
jgi:hypothetical protein